jgi:Zn-dependent peptidase ImmA (M78 family)
MNKTLIVLIIISLAVGTIYGILTIKKPCEEPLLYSIGFVDSRHNMTEDELLDLIGDAEKVWEEPVEKNLFEYNKKGKLVINLIFDERQEHQIELNKKHEVLDNMAEYLETERSKLEQKKRDYETKKAAFEARLERWNSGDRTDENEYNALRSDENELKLMSKELKTLVDEFNDKVSEYNSDALESNNEADITQQAGEAYGGDSINIYLLNGDGSDKFLIAHELGHALGIERHANDVNSLMHYKLPENIEEISYEDIRMLKEVCSILEEN